MQIRLDDESEGRARQLDGNILTFESPRAFAPGAPIRFEASPAGDLRNFEGRSLGSKRMDAGTFVVRMRFVNLTRNDRASLVDVLGASTEP